MFYKIYILRFPRVPCYTYYELLFIPAKSRTTGEYVIGDYSNMSDYLDYFTYNKGYSYITSCVFILLFGIESIERYDDDERTLEITSVTGTKYKIK